MRIGILGSGLMGAKLGTIFTSWQEVVFSYVAALVAMNRPDQLPFHLNYAGQNGAQKEELIEVITHLAFYSGWPNAMSAIMVAKEVRTKG